MDDALRAALQQMGLERAHMVAVRTAFGAALKAPNKSARFADFYAACVDYLDFIMARFREQDQVSVDLLRPRVPKENKEGHRLIDETHAGLESSREEIKKLVAALKRFRSEGPAGQTAFEQAGLAFVDYFVTQLSKIKHAVRPLSEQYVKPGEIDRSSFITPEATRREQELFAQVGKTLPAGVSFEVKMEDQQWRGESVGISRSQ